jgi:hypothetical protein
VKLTQGGEATLWLLDDFERPLSAKGTTASIQLVLAGSKEITLAYDVIPCLRTGAPYWDTLLFLEAKGFDDKDQLTQVAKGRILLGISMSP